MTTITNQCRLCGQPVTVHRPVLEGDLADLADAAVRQWGPAIVHDKCFDNFRYGQENEAAAVKLMRRAELWETLCPAIFQETVAAKIPRQDSLKKVMAWEMGGKGLLLHGKTGKGKTRCAWLLLRREFDAGRFIVAISHTEFARRATDLARSGSEQAPKWVGIVSKCDIFFIDDLGKSRFKTATGDGKMAEELLFDILDARWTAKRPCIITTNMRGEDLAATMSPDRGEPFLRRLREFQTAVNF